MRNAFGAALLLLVMLPVSGCEDSLPTLNRLAAAGLIHEDAPITAHLQIQIGIND